MCNDPIEMARRAAQGDLEAYGDLVNQYQVAIFNVAYRMLGVVAEAEDVSQDTFIRAYRSLNTYDLERPILPWLKKIAVNLCLDRLKHPLELPLEDELLSGSSGPEIQVMQRDQDQQVRRSLLALPPHYRAVIELRHFQEMSYEEIALALRRPLASIKTELFRARKMLAERLKDMQ
ncbi:ECF RNA polymerase sigma factor SigW [bioreactor metagenome]|uniref:ECF RNA polymerase sigma factor SigW n=1 Tax=bioreactor metagenome TaxID=1076179 RepID=A0A645A6S2_9ZZZZ